MRFNWEPSDAGFIARVGNNITLSVSPDRVKFSKPARGTKWRAQASHWNEATRTMSRYGRDVYTILHNTKQEAMKLAELIYLEQQ